MQKYFYSLLCLFLMTFLCINHVNGEELESKAMVEHLDDDGIDAIQKIPELNIVVFHLHNGMKVCVKSTDFDDEVSLRLSALGGFSFLPSSERASGELAPEIAFRSGLGDFRFDQLNVHLYEHSVEFNSTIQPFCRVIEGTSFPEELETLFNLVHWQFTKHKFSDKPFQQVLRNNKEKLKQRYKDNSRSFEDTYMSFNMQNYFPLRPLTSKDIDKVDFQTARSFYDNCFGDPSNFVCVIVGQCKMEKVRALIAKYLASIPPRKDLEIPQLPRLPILSKGVKTKIVRKYNREQSITRLTFPINEIITEKNIDVIEAVAKLMRMRLQNEIIERTKGPIEINVALEFPLYPSLELPWLRIEYISDPKLVTPIGQMILSEVKRMQRDRVTAAEIAFLRKNFQENDRLWQKDNNYWVMILSNYLLWDWDPRGIKEKHESESCFDPEIMKVILRNYISLDNYTIVSGQP